jgi:hypothetical protein
MAGFLLALLYRLGTRRNPLNCLIEALEITQILNVPAGAAREAGGSADGIVDLTDAEAAEIAQAFLHNWRRTGAIDAADPGGAVHKSLVERRMVPSSSRAARHGWSKKVTTSVSGGSDIENLTLLSNLDKTHFTIPALYGQRAMFSEHIPVQQEQRGATRNCVRCVLDGEIQLLSMLDKRGVL